MHRSNLTTQNIPNYDQVQLSKLSNDIDTILNTMVGLEQKIDKLVPGHVEAEWFSTKGAAERLGLAEWTVRKYCTDRRILAVKRADGKWKISAAEIKRYKEHGPSQECKLDV